MTAAIRVVGPDEGRPLRGGSHLLKAGAGDTAGALALWVSHTSYRGGPPLHLHEREDELFYVLSGRYELLCGGDSALAEAGALAFMPRGTPHRFRGDDAETPCRLLHAVVPGGFEEYLATIRDSSPDTPEGREIRRIAGERFGLRFPADALEKSPGAEREPPMLLLGAPATVELEPGEARAAPRIGFDDTAGRTAFGELHVADGVDFRIAPEATLRVAYLMAGAVELDDGDCRRSLPTGTTVIVPAGASGHLRNTGGASARLAFLTLGSAGP